MANLPKMLVWVLNRVRCICPRFDVVSGSRPNLTNSRWHHRSDPCWYWNQSRSFLKIFSLILKYGKTLQAEYRKMVSKIQLSLLSRYRKENTVMMQHVAWPQTWRSVGGREPIGAGPWTSWIEPIFGWRHWVQESEWWLVKPYWFGRMLERTIWVFLGLTTSHIGSDVCWNEPYEMFLGLTTRRTEPLLEKTHLEDVEETQKIGANCTKNNHDSIGKSNQFYVNDNRVPHCRSAYTH